MKRSVSLVMCALVFIGVASGCTKNTPESLARDGKENHCKGNGHVVFFQEPDTGLCFAYMWSGDYYGGPAMSEVQCTPAVMQRLCPISGLRGVGISNGIF